MAQNTLRAMLGPQYPSDDAFTKRMRAHQSWFRTAVLNEPFGVGPQQGSETHYGNYLQPNAAERGVNFLTPDIWGVARERLNAGPGVERYRCLHNLLSSQPMCFNLFGLLRARLELATRLLGALWPEEVGEVDEVAIEWAPTPTGRYLDDATSFDAFVRYRRAGDGTPAFLAIETKLTEPFSQKRYPYDHRPAYREITERRDGPWSPTAPAQVTDLAWSQLWRNHMLTVALAEDPDSPFTAGWPVVVHHPDDKGATDTVRGYQALLTDPSFVRTFDLRDIVDRWRPLLDDPADRQWIDLFDARYLHLKLSRHAFQALEAGPAAGS